jgi:hypothetical protein
MANQIRHLRHSIGLDRCRGQCKIRSGVYVTISKIMMPRRSWISVILKEISRLAMVSFLLIDAFTIENSLHGKLVLIVNFFISFS